MYGARAGDFQFEGRETLDFFLTQCEVTASSWRRDRLPLNHPVQWRSIGPINVRDLELSEVFNNATRPAYISPAVWNDMSREAWNLLIPLIKKKEHQGVIAGVPKNDGVALIKSMRGASGTVKQRLRQYRLPNWLPGGRPCGPLPLSAPYSVCCW